MRETYEMNLKTIRDIYPNRAALKPKEAAEVLGVHETTLLRWLKRKKNPIPCKATFHQSGRNTVYIIPVAALARWMTV